MGFVYHSQPNSPSPFIPFRINSSLPTDERVVIDTRSNLINPETWGPYDAINEIYVNYTYSGIIVSVVNDTPENNGVYMLVNRFKYTKFADIDTSDPDYDIDGWRKIAGGGTPPPVSVSIDKFTIKDGTEEWSPDDTQQSGLHVVRVDGGNFE